MSSKSQNSISYTLFLYREQLKRGKASMRHLNRTKISLTDKLISKSVRNLEQCTTEDLRTINRELLFKKKLKYQMQKISQMEKMAKIKTN